MILFVLKLQMGKIFGNVSKCPHNLTFQCSLFCVSSPLSNCYKFASSWITAGAFRVLMKRLCRKMNGERGYGAIPDNVTYGSEAWHSFTDSMPWVVLWLDGQTTHHDSEAMKEARRNKIIMGTFIPHTTHLCQPLDRNVNSAIKVFRIMSLRFQFLSQLMLFFSF
jgi:hypothetical protein